MKEIRGMKIVQLHAAAAVRSARLWPRTLEPVAGTGPVLAR
jgi:hypothetical protein